MDLIFYLVVQLEDEKMKGYFVEFSRIVWEKIPMKREPTPKELRFIKKNEYFELPDDLLDWSQAEMTNEDFSYGQVILTLDGKKTVMIPSKYPNMNK